MLVHNKMKKKPKIILTYGTFDCFHHGHLRLLQRAKAMGDVLIVGLSTDKFNEIKGKKSVFTYSQRYNMLLDIKCVDKIIPESDWHQKTRDVQAFKVDTFVMGDDWTGKFDELKKYCEVVYLPRTPEISTTKIKLIINT